MVAAAKKVPLTTSDNVNIEADPSAGMKPPGKTIEEMYQKKSQLEHILIRPDTYIGSIDKHTQTLWVYEDSKMIQRPISFVPGLYKIFDEILVNAADNKQRDPKMDALKVVIDPENNLISVYNSGHGVPVEIHKEEGVYVPELIFGHLLTSSNYDDTQKKTTGGRNGYGAKLANIFSTEFIIETADGKRLKKYKQVFSNNMGKRSEPVIGKCKEGENWTKVTFKPDLAKFNMTHLEEDVVALMKKRVVDVAGCLGKTVKVELNGSRVPVKSFQDYVNLYLTSASEAGANRLPSFYEKVGDRWEVCVSISDGQFRQVSFVNGIATIKGGTHVDYVTNQIANHVMTVANKKNKNANVKAHNVKSYLWVFVNALIDNPAFDSQTKETLTLRQSSFGSKCELSEDLLKKVAKSDIMDNLLSWAKFKQEKDLKKTDGTKKGKVNVPKLEDANEAGGRNSDKCTLILTEGDSAKALAIAGVAGLSQTERDYYGVFPLRGKLLNVREATTKQLNENKEIESIKKILGLQQNKEYSNVKSLRYGHLMIMTDQDHDGSHIKGLLINFIHSFWPSLLKVPSFMVEFITPIVKATHRNGTVLPFYTMPEYEAWKESLGGSASGWTIKYYKGLGTSTSKEGKEYFKNLRMHRKDFEWVDEQDGDAIELAFSKKKIEARKNWLRQYEPGTHLDHNERIIKYSDFINKELILFSMADLQRSIPSMVDGLKPGQRKILFCCFKRNFVKEAKVAQFSGYVSEHSAYHHGEASLAGTIIGMAQDFVGSNNINLLQPNGQFGTRSVGGKDHASARYIYTKLSPITRFLFPKDDDCLLNYLDEDGQSIEPTWYMPIIPMVLVNGCEGIGTGWSTSIPNYSPRDIVANIRRLLNGEMMEPMHPWYRGFKGVIEKGTSKEFYYTVDGLIDELNETTVKITELPVKKWTDDYKVYLNSVTEGIKDENGNLPKDPFVKDFRKYGDDASVDFEVLLSEEKMMLAKQEGLLKKFKLSSSISTSNMHLFDPSGVIKKYDSPEQILDDFFHLRLEFYEKRRRILLENFELELSKLDNKVRFILGVVKGEIIVSNRKRAELFLELHQKGFTPFPKKAKAIVAGETDDTVESEENSESAITNGVRPSDYDYLVSMAIGSLTLEKVRQLCADRDKLSEEVDILRKTTPKGLWVKDLDNLEMQLEALDKYDAEAEEARQKLKPGADGFKVSKVAARKNTKKATTAEPAPVGTSTSLTTESAPEVVKPKGAAGAKKAPAKKQKESTLVLDDEDDEIDALKDRLKAYTFDDSSPENSKMDTNKQPQVAAAAKKKAPAKRAAGGRKKVQTITDSDEDSDVEVLAAAPKGGRGRKPAAAAKPPAGPKKRTAGQKLLTEMLEPAAVAAPPPEKVRKMRKSPFNKKSGSVLDRLAAQNEKDDDDDSSAPASETVTGSGGSSATGGSTDEVMPTRGARPQRANRTQTRYVLSDSEPEKEDSDFEEKDDGSTEDSDFEEED